MTQGEASPNSEPRRLAVQYLTDEGGNRVSVVLSVADFEQLLDDLEEVYDARAYNAGKAEGGEPVPWETVKAEHRGERPLDEVLAEIERDRGWHIDP